MTVLDSDRNRGRLPIYGLVGGSSPSRRTTLRILYIFMKKIWRIWAKALGEKASPCDKESVIVAGVRTLIVFVYIITNLVIMSGIIHHWNDH